MNHQDKPLQPPPLQPQLPPPLHPPPPYEYPTGPPVFHQPPAFSPQYPYGNYASGITAAYPQYQQQPPPHGYMPVAPPGRALPGQVNYSSVRRPNNNHRPNQRIVVVDSSRRRRQERDPYEAACMGALCAACLCCMIADYD